MRAFVVLSLALAWCGMTTAAAKLPAPPDEMVTRAQAAAPSEAYAQPKKPRKVLVYTRTNGFRHSSIPIGVTALRIMGEKTGAYTIEHSEDPGVFAPKSLARFDAVIMLNTTGEAFEAVRNGASADKQQQEWQSNLLAFVGGGGGLVGIHSATDTCYQWPEFGRLMGGYFDGHPWHEPVVIKIDDPDHPLTQMFNHQPLALTEEIYQLKDPYSRRTHRVLLSLDTDKTDMSKPGVHRTDDDYAVSQVRTYGKGRVFYCSLGHREEIYWNPKILRHYLAGIQFAMADLDAPHAPSDPRSPLASDWQPLLPTSGRLDGWKAWLPPTGAERPSAERLAELAAANAERDQHWKLADGVLSYDGRGTSLASTTEYSEFELKLDWQIEAGGDSGIYLRGLPQVQIWDKPAGSGGLYNNQQHPSKPTKNADRAPGEWNTFHITLVDDRVWVELNGEQVVHGVPLENYWDREGPLPARGPIVLQSHGTPLQFRNLVVRAPSREARQRAAQSPGWQTLFAGASLDDWQFKGTSWKIEDGTLSRQGGGDIWSKQQYGDFILHAEYKLSDGANSGIFFRTADLNDMVQTGIEVQVLDSHGKEQVGKHDAGAIYDIKEPRVNAVHPPGEWNHCVLICRGSQVWVALNGQTVIDLDLDNWTQPHQNPDGSRNKFQTPYKDMPRRGHIGFQDHGNPVWYRNVFVKPLVD